MDIKRIRELISFLVSMAAEHNEEDAEMARIFADELDELLPNYDEPDPPGGYGVCRDTGTLSQENIDGWE